MGTATSRGSPIAGGAISATSRASCHASPGRIEAREGVQRLDGARQRGRVGLGGVDRRVRAGQGRPYLVSAPIVERRGAVRPVDGLLGAPAGGLELAPGVEGAPAIAVDARAIVELLHLADQLAARPERARPQGHQARARQGVGEQRVVPQLPRRGGDLSVAAGGGRVATEAVQVAGEVVQGARDPDRIGEDPREGQRLLVVLERLRDPPEQRERRPPARVPELRDAAIGVIDRRREGGEGARMVAAGEADLAEDDGRVARLREIVARCGARGFLGQIGREIDLARPVRPPRPAQAGLAGGGGIGVHARQRLEIGEEGVVDIAIAAGLGGVERLAQQIALEDRIGGDLRGFDDLAGLEVRAGGLVGPARRRPVVRALRRIGEDRGELVVHLRTDDRAVDGAARLIEGAEHGGGRHVERAREGVHVDLAARAGQQAGQRRDEALDPLHVPLDAPGGARVVEPVAEPLREQLRIEVLEQLAVAVPQGRGGDRHEGPVVEPVVRPRQAPQGVQRLTQAVAAPRPPQHLGHLLARHGAAVDHEHPDQRAPLRGRDLDGGARPARRERPHDAHRQRHRPPRSPTAAPPHPAMVDPSRPLSGRASPVA